MNHKLVKIITKWRKENNLFMFMFYVYVSKVEIGSISSGVSIEWSIVSLRKVNF